MTQQRVENTTTSGVRTGRFTGVLSAGLLSGLLILGAHVSETDAAGSATCQTAGQWLDPQDRQLLQSPTLLAEAAEPGIVLLGEAHTSSEDHLWQLQTLAGLHAHHPRIVIGFEAFPRAVQPILDEWSRGELSEQDFLKKVRWDEVWGYDAGFYMPLFHFARQNRLPMVALNVDRGLVSRVGREGWADIPADEREGLDDPAAASDDYRRSLARVYAAKAARRHTAPDSAQSEDSAPDTLPSIDAILDDPGFDRFVQAQLTWDRAMAEALAEARQSDPEALVVGILGRGHVEYGYGVPHQLADLGKAPVTSFLPVRTGKACDDLEPALADAVFLVDDRSFDTDAPERPRLGVFIETAEEGGVRLLEIVDDSIAAATELSAGDVIVEAAGTRLETTADLVEVVSRQAPGTWLPLNVMRDGEKLELVAKFPSLPDDQP